MCNETKTAGITVEIKAENKMLEATERNSPFDALATVVCVNENGAGGSVGNPAESHYMPPVGCRHAILFAISITHGRTVILVDAFEHRKFRQERHVQLRHVDSRFRHLILHNKHKKVQSQCCLLKSALS